MVRPTPSPEAAIKPTVLATTTTARMTTKSTKVSLERAKAKDFQSIIFTPMTTKSAAKEAIGTHAIKGVKTKIAIKDHSP